MYPPNNAPEPDMHIKNSHKSITNLEITPYFGELSQKTIHALAPCSMDYEFLLANLDEECYYRDVSVNFKPLWDDRQRKYVRAHPEFNLDGKHWSPAFMVQTQFRADEEWEAKFNKRVQELNQISKQMPQEPKFPMKVGASHCRVCDCKIESYELHVASRFHIKNVNNSAGQRYILELIRLRQKQIRVKSKRSAVLKQSSEQVPNPKKKKIKKAPKKHSPKTSI